MPLRYAAAPMSKGIFIFRRKLLFLPSRVLEVLEERSSRILRNNTEKKRSPAATLKKIANIIFESIFPLKVHDSFRTLS